MTTEVTRLYDAFPFPSPGAELPLIEVVADEMHLLVEDGSLDGWTVLDAGCGTGHTLVGLARACPGARFVGLDACGTSLDIARSLAERHGTDNVEFVHGDLLDVRLHRRFDLVVSFGVVHHLPDPRAGLHRLAGLLADDGLLHLWLYNSTGEHGRMFDRELVRLLAAGDDPASGLAAARALGLRLSLDRYGFPAGWTGAGMSPAEQDVFDADAYAHPVVHTMRFADVPDLFAGVGVDWVAADRVYGPRGTPFVDLGGTQADPGGHVRCEDLFDDPDLRGRAASLDNLGRARAIELALRPTGFRLLAGRGAGLLRCVPRIRGNLLIP
ncbi:class I SAM-dependent methyltransferase [Streptomyces sp. HB2AG]|uniref:class I SAM-dependent methyltransferase n=1 Tax=Streptomyces sp. HB2AG TaxID=2983400 RepID=UPI0022AA2CB2|nr:class I SAM-dependent methyltransferase [Streptomyces sp. HB2AG]MCZ2523488.1 class I SAM-dependent methyltransferase [Streptomyces sp. HB2AG]